MVTCLCIPTYTDSPMYAHNQEEVRIGTCFAGGVQKGINIVGLSVCKVIAVLHSALNSNLRAKSI